MPHRFAPSANKKQIASQSGGNQGLGFAVPINTAVSVMKQLQATGRVTYAYLGVQGQTITSDIAGADAPHDGPVSDRSQVRRWLDRVHEPAGAAR